MILVKIMGGLGNQLFQYAAGRSLALKHNTSLKLDLSDYHEISFRKYYLHHFRIKADIATFSDIFPLYKPEWINQVFSNYCGNRVANKSLQIMKRLGIYDLDVRYNQDPTNSSLLIGHVAAQRFIHYDHEFELLPDDVYLYGFWVSKRYFSKYKEQICRELTIHQPLMDNNLYLSNRIKELQSVSIHIRRTDKVSNPNFYPTTIDYCKRAIARIEELIKNPTYFIFSDDICWVKESFPQDSKFIFVDHNNDLTSYEDFRLMSMCKHNIIAESSFSWWAAILNSNQEKVVISPNPNRWINLPISHISEIMPKEWIVLY